MCCRSQQNFLVCHATGDDGSRLVVGETGGAAALNTKATSAAHSMTKCTTSSSTVFDDSTAAPAHERKLWTKSSSLIAGAGMIGHEFLELGSQQELDIQPYKIVILHWKFDLTPADGLFYVESPFDSISPTF